MPIRRLAGVLHALGVVEDAERRDRPLRSFDHSIIEVLVEEMNQGQQIAHKQVPGGSNLKMGLWNLFQRHNFRC